MAEAKTVVVNYTAEQTAQVVADYSAGVTVETIAENMGKTARSIIAKLSREGVYKAKVYKTKTGETVEKKDQTADAIGAVLKMTEPEIESLTKANKTALKKIWAALANSRPITPEDDKPAD
jgi:response regulator RpfG family c-di-GMP phosphodiesterase